MSDIDDVLDDAFHACHEPQPEECALCAARLELAQLRRAVVCADLIVHGLDHFDARLLETRSIGNAVKDYKDARAILAEIDGNPPA